MIEDNNNELDDMELSCSFCIFAGVKKNEKGFGIIERYCYHPKGAALKWGWCRSYNNDKWTKTECLNFMGEIE